MYYELGGIPEREMENFRAEADRLGKSSFAFAFYIKHNVKYPRLSTNTHTAGHTSQAGGQGTREPQYSKAASPGREGFRFVRAPPSPLQHEHGPLW